MSRPPCAVCSSYERCEHDAKDISCRYPYGFGMLALAVESALRDLASAREVKGRTRADHALRDARIERAQSELQRAYQKATGGSFP